MTEEILESQETEETSETEEIESESQQEEKRQILKLPEKEDNSVEIDGIKYPKELVEKAKKEGWTSKENLKIHGREKIYLDPQTFVERGELYPPFLNKKVEKKDEEIAVLKKMLQKKIAGDVQDKIESVEKQIKSAKEYGEIDSMESLVEKRAELKTELNEYAKEEEIIPPQAPQRPIEVIAWENKNPWAFDMSNPYNIKKTEEANRLLKEIKEGSPHLDLKTQLDLVDYNLQDFDNKLRQRANVTPPIQSQSTSTITPSNSKTFDNLTSNMRNIFAETCIDTDGKIFKGKALEIAKKTFLEDCTEECFKK